MLFQFENIDEQDAYDMWWCRRFNMLTDEEIKEKQESDPETWQDYVSSYNKHLYVRFTQFDAPIPEYNPAIIADNVPEEAMNDYRNTRLAIEEKDKFKVNSMMTDKFFKSKKNPFGLAFLEDTRPMYCFLYFGKVWNFLENQENIPRRPDALRMRIYSSSCKPYFIFGDGEQNIPETEEEEEMPSCSYAEYIMISIRKAAPVNKEGKSEGAKNFDWKQICMTEDFTEDFIREYRNYVDWGNVCKYQVLSEDFIEEFEDKINWGNVSKYQTLSETFIERHSDKIKWSTAIASQNEDELKKLPKFLRFTDEYQGLCPGVKYWTNNKITALNSISDSFILKHTSNDPNATVTWDEVISAGISEKWIDDHKDIVDWTAVCSNARMSEEFMDEHEDYIDWKALLEARDNLSAEFLNKHKKQIDWALASKTQTLTPEIIEEEYDKLDWKEVCKNQQLNEALIDKYPSRIDWNALLGNIKFTEAQLDKYFDKIKEFWRQVVACQEISPEWIESHAKDLSPQDWADTCNYIMLPEWFVRKHKEKVHWPAISGPIYTWITEAFIHEFQDYVDWEVICTFQKLSQQFLLNHFDRVNWKSISFNRYIDEEFMDKNKKKLDWNALCSYHNLSEQFMRDHQDYVVWFTAFKYQNMSQEFKNEFKWKLTKEQREELGL